LSQSVQGRIMNYRTGPREQASRECLIQFVNIESPALAGKLIGQKVKWKNATCILVGRIVSLHGRNGVVRVKFKKGVPGQAIGTTVELMS
jgi:large subunit ribosomal protein L35Ae